ncbi:hypothetical protein DAPPUDRAFT_303141 [Daphnia pulex]|uniref:Receptor-mediated endocytosis protein 6 homolog n=1 Tax=Daphnia pulex TaxID=6669 RepID=E9FSZ7_DAPPU|nr:hypothetical protein DAPPUDRAFT_303141 [Daphnia pulex]|eukprot:EFX89280.1 hypothetical protein DAPPUDRAFT_303141 [Daphnia pulex]
MLLDLARNLRQERLLIGSERQNLQTLNKKVSEALEKLHQLAWVASQQRINLDGLIISRLEVSPSFSCQQANALEGACFIEGYRHLGFHEALFSEFLQRLRENAPLLAVCLASGEKLSPETMPTVISVVTSSLYANFLLGDDEKYCLQLLKHLMELQLVSSENPRRLLRHGSCAFSRLYKAFTEGLFSAKVFLTAALHDPILFLLMEDEMYLDVDPIRAINRYPSYEREKRFGREGTQEFNSAIQKYRTTAIDRLVQLTQRFVSGLAASVACFPSSVAWLVRQMRSLLTHSMRIDARQVHAICVDLVFAFFICPAIVNPDPCGIVEAPISPIARSNLIQVAQILQVLVHSKWEPFDPKLDDLYSRFDKDCVSSILDAILDDGTPSANVAPFSPSSTQSSPSADPSVDTHRLLLGLNRSVALVTESELQTFVQFLRTVLTNDGLEANDKRTLESLLQPVPLLCSPVKSTLSQRKRNLLDKVNIRVRSKAANLLQRDSDHSFGIWSSSDDSGELGTPRHSNGEESPSSSGAVIGHVLVIPFSSKNEECIGMLSEQQVLALEQEKESTRASLDGSSVQGAEEMQQNPVQEKRTRFSLSHDEGSIGNTSDNLEAVSEAASNHSVESSVESENDEAEQDPIDNLSDMVSANVSGRGSPNVSGRDTPSSQVTEGDEGASRSGINEQRPLLMQAVPPKPSDIDDRFGRFDVKDLILGDETRSLVSDSWSTDVLGSDSELANETADRDRQPPLEDIVLPGRHLLVEAEAGLFDVSETASEAWSTDVVTSDTERMAEVDTDETSSVARSEADSEQDSTTSMLAVNAGSSHLGAIQRIRGRMSGSLFRPIREASVEQLQNLSLQSRSAPQQESSSNVSNGPMSSSSSSCSSHGSIASSAKGLATSTAAVAAMVNTTSSSAIGTATSISNGGQQASTGAIPKSISFDKTADRGDKENCYDDENKNKRGFFRNFKLPFKRGGRTKDRATAVDHPDNVNYTSYNRSLRRSASEEARTALATESSDDILAKYRSKGSNLAGQGDASASNGTQSMVAFNLAEEHSVDEDEGEDERQHIDPLNIESSYAFADAKRKLRLVLSTADVQSLHVMNNATAASNSTEHELIIFLKLQLAEAINLQDRSLVAQLHETLRCVRLFDAIGCSKLFHSLKEDYKGRAPYLSYLIQCRQSLLSVLAHLERLANRVEQDKAVCHRFLISVCVRLFLERREKQLNDFVVEFQQLHAADEKADWLESFLHRLSAELERDSMWQSASRYQIELAQTAVEQRLMALIYNYALYPNGDGDVSRDQVLYEHIEKLGQVVTPSHKDLRIPKIYRYECPWPSAQAELVSISAYKTPRDKVACVIRCATTIMNLLSLAAAAAERGVPAADDFMPVFVFVIIKANPPCLLSTVEYVNSFFGNRLEGEDQYWWTQFCSAIEFVKTMDYGH